jgi:uncharacterized protein YndB with AHSA1/START domain
MELEIVHKTLSFERRFKASPEKVFAAYADTGTRASWSAPTPTAKVVIDECDFRNGGREVTRCGEGDDLNYGLNLVYHLIVDNRMICFSEELWMGDVPLTSALVTYDIQPDGDGSKLVVTDQVTSFVGSEGLEGHGYGYEQALANLEALLSVRQ